MLGKAVVIECEGEPYESPTSEDKESGYPSTIGQCEPPSEHERVYDNPDRVVEPELRANALFEMIRESDRIIPAQYSVRVIFMNENVIAVDVVPEERPIFTLSPFEELAKCRLTISKGFLPRPSSF